MAKSKSQFRRLLIIDEKLREARALWLQAQRNQVDAQLSGLRLPNCQSLGGELEVSGKTIQRDLDFMRDEQGAPIAYDQAFRGYYYSEDNFSLPALKINESDLFAICVAEQSLKQYEGTPLYARLASVFGKIEDSLPDTVTLKAEWIGNRVSFREAPRRHLDDNIWSTVSESLNLSRRLLITYGTPNKSVQARKIDPYHLINHHGDWYVIGYCHKSDEIRVFAVSRIRKAELLNARYEIPANFDPKAILARSFGIMYTDRTYEVQVRFSPKAASYAMERDWHESQVIRTNNDGSVVLGFKVNDLREIRSWILSWGAEAKVLSPRELASGLAADLQRAAAQYT